MILTLSSDLLHVPLYLRSPFSHEDRNIGFGHIATSERKHDVCEFLFRGSKFVAIQLQKNKAGHGANSFVAVQKRMVSDDMK